MKDRAIGFIWACCLFVPLAAIAQRTLITTEMGHEDLVFFEGKKLCGTSQTQVNSDFRVAKVAFVNNSGGSIFFSDDTSVAVTDTEVIDTGSLNDLAITNLNQVYCIADSSAKTIHYVGIR